MKKQLISSALAFCAFAMILPGAVFAQENLAAAPACTQNEGCQATQHKPGCPVGQALLQDDDPGNMPANGNAPLNNEDDDPGNMPANGNASLNNEGGQAAPKAAGPYEYNGVSYPALSDAVKAVGARAGTVYVTEDAFIRSNEIIEIPAGADITITSKGGAAFRITKEAHRFVFKLLGGKLTLENIVLDGNAQWKDASSGLGYERTAQGTAASLPLIYAQAQVGGHPGSGSRLVLSSGCVIQNFYVNRAADNIDTDPVLGGWSGSEELCLFSLANTDVTIHGAVLKDNAVKSDVAFYRNAYGRGIICPGIIQAMSCTIKMKDGTMARNWIVSDVGHSAEGQGWLDAQRSRYSSALREGASGGHLTMTGGRFLMEGGTLSQGYAADGGAIAALDAEIVLTGGNIVDNVAERVGGGVLMWDTGCKFTMKGGRISGNKTLNRIAGYDDSVRKTVGCGGALCMTGGDAQGSELRITSGEISDNSAVQGGGIWLNRCSGEISNAAIRGNKALPAAENMLGAGGGILFANGTLALDGNTEVSGNHAVQGGGIANGARGQLIVKGRAGIRGNEATSLGGGLCLNGVGISSILMEQATIAGNKANAKNGGDAVFIFSPSEKEIPKFFLNAQNSELKGDIVLHAANEKALPVLSLNAAVPASKRYMVKFYDAAYATRGRRLVAPGAYGLPGEKAISSAEPYAQSFQNNVMDVIPGSLLQEPTALVLGKKPAVPAPAASTAPASAPAAAGAKKNPKTGVPNTGGNSPAPEHPLEGNGFLCP